jgi:hypothetical protein
MAKDLTDKDILPPYAQDLILQLDEWIPHRCPSPSQSDREIWMYAGKRQLIDHLLSRLEYTEENAYQAEMK